MAQIKDLQTVLKFSYMQSDYRHPKPVRTYLLILSLIYEYNEQWVYISSDHMQFDKLTGSEEKRTTNKPYLCNYIPELLSFLRIH